MNKSLVPLILILGLIVLLTSVILNTRTIKETERGRGSPLDDSSPSIKISPYGAAEKIKPHTLKQQHKSSAQRNVSSKISDAYAEMRANNLKSAEQKLRSILIVNPKNYSALTLLGRVHYISKNYKDAETVFRKQATIRRNDPAVYNNLGQALARQGKFDDALEQLISAHELDPKSPLISLNLSGVYSALGKKKKALRYFRSAFDQLGSRIIPVANDPVLDNIREDPEFQDIMAKARGMALSNGQQSPTKPPKKL